MSEKADCPKQVNEDVCIARMETMLEKVNGIKAAIYVSVTTLGVVLTVIEIILRVWRP